MSRILVVEDEPQVARDLREILEQLGHAVTGVANSHDSALLRQREDPAELALLDVGIAGPRDGVALAVELREEGCRAIAFITGRDDPTTLARAAAVRANAYLIKPFTPAQIAATVTMALLQAVAEPAAVDHAVLARLAPKAGTLTPEQMARVSQHIACYLDQPINIGQLAGLCELDRFSFSRRFKNTTGTTPHKFLVEQRLTEARRLLRNTEWSLADIALATGFGSQAHFTSAFHKATGVTPSGYRRSAQG